MPQLHLHLPAKTRQQRFQVKRKSRAERMRAKLKEVKEELRRRMHQPIPGQGHWLKQVVQGYFKDHAVPTNYRALSAFRYHVSELWRRTLRRRSQKDNTTWQRIDPATGGSKKGRFCTGRWWPIRARASSGLAAAGASWRWASRAFCGMMR